LEVGLVVATKRNLKYVAAAQVRHRLLLLPPTAS
jgi:hypothetical protein